MEAAMEMVIDSRGVVRCLYAEEIDLSVLGTMHIQRASHVEPDATGKWWADLSPVDGPRLGPFDRRSQALHAESQWLNQHCLTKPRPCYCR
jgi:hypothetical protein